MNAKLIGATIFLLGLALPLGEAQLPTRRPTTATTVRTTTRATTAVTRSTALVQNVTNFTAPFNYLRYEYQVHSCLQMIGWCILAAIGFFIEVHFPIFLRPRGREVKLHGLMQLMSVVFAVAGIVVLIVYAGFSPDWSLHKILGLSAMVVRLIGTVMICFGPPKYGPPKTFHLVAARLRIVFTRISFVLSIVTVFTGLAALYGQLPQPTWAYLLLFTYIAIDLGLELAMFIHAYRAKKSEDEESKQLIERPKEDDDDLSSDDFENTFENRMKRSVYRRVIVLSFILSSIGISVAIIVGAIYADPSWYY